MISREEAIECIEAIRVQMFNGGNSKWTKACDMAIEALKEERQHDAWISCSKRLPEESMNSVIGWDRYRERCVFVQYMDGHFQITGKTESFDIIAWMPIPTPYQKEGDAK